MAGRVCVVLIAGLFLVVGCTSDSDGSMSTTSASVATTSVEEPEERARIAYRLIESEELSGEHSDFTGIVWLHECRWRSPGELALEVRWIPDDGAAKSATVPVFLGFPSGDMIDGYSLELTLTEPGDGIIEFDLYAAEQQESSGGIQRWSGHRGAAVSDSCSLDWYVDGERFSIPAVPLRIDLHTEAVEAESDLERLVADIDPTDSSERLLPLALLFAHPDLPVIDRLFVHDSATLVWISIEETGRCLMITSEYEGGPYITQNLGCPRQSVSEDEPSARIPDDVWDVVAHEFGSPVESFVDGVGPVFDATVDPFELGETALDIDSLVDAKLEEDDLNEIARLDWGGGRVAVVLDASGTSCCESFFGSFAVLPEESSYGGSGQACREYWAMIQTYGDLAFLLVVTPTLESEMFVSHAGSTVPIPLEPADGGRGVGLWDMSDIAEPESDWPDLVDSQGQPLACDQG